MVHLAIKRCLNGDFGEHLPELIEIGFGLDAVGGPLSQRLKIFPYSWSAYPYPLSGLMIGSYTEISTVLDSGLVIALILTILEHCIEHSLKRRLGCQRVSGGSL
jgi:hypothetical protein